MRPSRVPSVSVTADETSRPSSDGRLAHPCDTDASRTASQGRTRRFTLARSGLRLSDSRTVAPDLLGGAHQFREACLHDLRCDQHGLAPAQVVLYPRLVRVADEVAERRARFGYELLWFGLWRRSACAQHTIAKPTTMPLIETLGSVARAFMVGSSQANIMRATAALRSRSPANGCFRSI